jgi:serine/threonine-protein kinase
LSPEQASGEPVTPATDVYSLGVVLYELLTGEVPFPGENFVAVAMKHINEPPPDLSEQRPDVPLRLVAAVERALEKDPPQRFPSMSAFASELRQCLVELRSADEERTFIAQSPVLKQSPPHRVRTTRRRRPLFALVLLVVAAAIAAGILELGGSKAKKGPGSPGVLRVVPLSGVTGYDPQGTGGEHDADAAKATDHNPATYWQTETYDSPDFGGLGKSGVGLVVDAGGPIKLSSVTVTTDTPGFTAQIQEGSSSTGPFVPDSSLRTVNGRTTFKLDGKSGRYYVVWITQLPPGAVAHVNEVTARGK